MLYIISSLISTCIIQALEYLPILFQLRSESIDLAAQPLFLARKRRRRFSSDVNATRRLKRRDGEQGEAVGNGVTKGGVRERVEQKGMNETEKVRLIKGRLNDGVCPPTSIRVLPPSHPIRRGSLARTNAESSRGFLKF